MKVKQVLRILFSSYMILTLVVGTAGVPVLIHTCSQNLKTDVHLFAGQEDGDCHMDCGDKEADCCTQENQHIQLDIDNGTQVLINTHTIISLFYQPVIIDVEMDDSPTVRTESYEPILNSSGRHLRLEIQSILC